MSTYYYLSISLFPFFAHSSSIGVLPTNDQITIAGLNVTTNDLTRLDVNNIMLVFT